MPPEPEASHRQTPSERLHEVTMAAIQRAATPPESSVTFTRNARGVVQIEVTVRAYDPTEAYDAAEQLFETAAAAYPYPEPDDDPKGGAK